METKRKHSDIDMLHGPLAGKLLLFTLPIALSSMIQQLFNTADTAIVGYFGNADCPVIIPFYRHCRRYFRTMYCRSSSTPDSHPGKYFSPCQTLPADLYAGISFLLLYDFGSSILRARGDSRYPFLALMLSGIINVGLNLVFVFFFHMSVAGVAIATNISTLFPPSLSPARTMLWDSLKDAKKSSGSAWSYQPYAVPFPFLLLSCSVIFFWPVHHRNHSNKQRFPAYLCILLFEPICNLYEIPAGALRGSGHALYPAVSTVIGTCLFRIIWIFTVFQTSPTLSMLYHAFPLSWIVTILLVNTGTIILLRKAFYINI